jgi:LemA protein
MRRDDLKENAGGHGQRRRLRYLVPLLALLAGACGYGEIQQLGEQVGEARSDIEVQLQRRTELIPTLLETIARYVRVDVKTLAAVSDSRVELVGAVRARDLVEMETASRELSQAVAQLLAETAENRELQSDLAFRLLNSQLEGIEQEITEAGRMYNEAVQRYNAYIAQFPQLVTAKVIGAVPQRYFELAAAATSPSAAGA